MLPNWRSFFRGDWGLHWSMDCVTWFAIVLYSTKSLPQEQTRLATCLGLVKSWHFRVLISREAQGMLFGGVPLNKGNQRQLPSYNLQFSLGLLIPSPSGEEFPPHSVSPFWFFRAARCFLGPSPHSGCISRRRRWNVPALALLHLKSCRHWTLYSGGWLSLQPWHLSKHPALSSAADYWWTTRGGQCASALVEHGPSCLRRVPVLEKKKITVA